MTTSVDRLGRLLNLVPYLLARPGIRVADAAVDLGVSERQLRQDLELLWLCGLPGYGPGDLIDLAFDGDRVTVTYDAGIDRPLRLTPDEATAMVVALRMLAQTPGMADQQALQRALSKIEHAAGEHADAPVAVGLRTNPDRLAVFDGALRRKHALRITYYTASRDETSQRTVDPMRVLVVDDRGYLEAWCRKANAVRLFRIDRVDGCVELDEPAAVPAHAVGLDLRDGVFRPGADLPLVVLRLARPARWITEYYHCESVERHDGGDWLVTLRVSDLDWARRLVLGLGPDAAVVAPAELAFSVAGEVERTLARYERMGEPAGVGPEAVAGRGAHGAAVD